MDRKRKTKRRGKKPVLKKRTSNLRKKMTKRLKYKKNNYGFTKKFNMKKILKFLKLQKGGG